MNLIFCHNVYNNSNCNMDCFKKLKNINVIYHGSNNGLALGLINGCFNWRSY